MGWAYDDARWFFAGHGSSVAQSGGRRPVCAGYVLVPSGGVLVVVDLSCQTAPVPACRTVVRIYRESDGCMGSSSVHVDPLAASSPRAANPYQGDKA